MKMQEIDKLINNNQLTYDLLFMNFDENKSCTASACQKDQPKNL